MLTSLRTISTTVPPVTVDLVKQHTRIDADADDNLVQLYLLTSTQLVEGYLGRSLCNQQYRYTVAQTLPPNSWPWTAAFIPILPLGLSWTMFHLGHRPMELPRSPAVSVDLVAYGSWTSPDTVLVARANSG